MSRHDHPLFRTVALLAAVCVLALAVFAASPDFHASLHKNAPVDHSVPVGDADHVCAVTLFASCLTALLVFCFLMLGRLAVRGITQHARDEIAWAHPRYRLVPAHAPPAA